MNKIDIQYVTWSWATISLGFIGADSAKVTQRSHLLLCESSHYNA